MFSFSPQAEVLSFLMARSVSIGIFPHHSNITGLRITLVPFFSPVFTGIVGQKVRVEEELEAYPMESVELRCKFIDGGGRTKLTQVQRQCFITLSSRNVT